MKLLILTQIVDTNNDVLGFFHGWIAEFAKKYERVTVICLFEGKHNLPSNVEVLSLGKERGVSKITYLLRFFFYSISRAGQYDQVFVHMNQIYIVLLGWFWRLSGKKIGLWYTHRQTSFSLWIAEKFVHNIFTAAKESFLLPSKKIHIMGHGINVHRFIPNIDAKNKQIPLFIHVGRITPIKNIDTLIDASAILSKKGFQHEVLICGRPQIDKDVLYDKELKEKTKKLGLSHVTFRQDVSNEEIVTLYQKADLSVNLTPTGGIDKAVLESWATQTPCLVSNEAFRGYYGEYQNDLVFAFRDGNDLAQKIEKMMTRKDREELISTLTQYVRNNFSTEGIVGRITGMMGV